MREHLEILTDEEFEKAFEELPKEPRHLLIKDDTPEYRKGYYDGYHTGYNTAKRWFAKGIKKQNKEFSERLETFEISSVYPLSLFEDIAEDQEKKLIYSPTLINDMLNERLTERERRILEMRRRDQMTLEVVGKKLGITQERVRQIEAKALRKLRNPIVLKYIECVSKQDFIKADSERLKLLNENEYLKQKIVEILGEPVQEKTESENEYLKQKIAELSGEPVQEKTVTIEELNLSIRAFNCLRRAGIFTVEDLKKLTPTKLYRIRNLGRKTAKEIADKCADLGIEIGGTANDGTGF